MWLPTLKKLAMSMFSAATVVTPFVAVHGTKTCVTTYYQNNTQHRTPHNQHNINTSHPSPRACPCVTPMPPMEDGSDLDVEGVEGDDDEYDFMPDARDIMNKSPRPDAAASTEIRAFRETFGTSLPIVSMVWSMLWEEDVVPEGGRPKHLLWALHFLKVYPLQAPGCAAVGGSAGAVDAKTHKKWVWAFIDAIAELVDEVVSKITVWGPVRV